MVVTLLTEQDAREGYILYILTLALLLAGKDNAICW